MIDSPFNNKKTSYDFVLMEKLLAPNDTISKFIANEGPFVGPAMRFQLPLNVPSFEGDAVQITDKAWLMDHESLYLHPEYLAPVSQYKINRRQFEFPVINPKFQGRRYTSMLTDRAFRQGFFPDLSGSWIRS